MLCWMEVVAISDNKIPDIISGEKRGRKIRQKILSFVFFFMFLLHTLLFIFHDFLKLLKQKVALVRNQNVMFIYYFELVFKKRI